MCTDGITTLYLITYKQSSSKVSEVLKLSALPAVKIKQDNKGFSIISVYQQDHTDAHVSGLHNEGESRSYSSLLHLHNIILCLIQVSINHLPKKSSSS